MTKIEANPESSENLIIERKSRSFKAIEGSYREKVIYIDPYNTGKDFVYSDNFYRQKRR
jgi:hypothetical protein